ncbi:MAG: hypothetical protein KC457_10060, partial [Myxococcales bacterium]|nr:hypothetical protein [Myxococcales bacterium]
DVRHATMIDFTYALILWVFKTMSNIPMSTTWVFVGLLAGRELAMAMREPTVDPRMSHPDPFQRTAPHTVTEVVLDPWGRPVRRVVVVRPR